MSNTASVEVVAGDTTNLDAHMPSQQRWEREHGAGCAGAERAQTWPGRSTRSSSDDTGKQHNNDAVRTLGVVTRVDSVDGLEVQEVVHVDFVLQNDNNSGNAATA